MKKICLFIFSLLMLATGFAQYKNDNVLYKTIDPQLLCNALKNNKTYLLLDVRSPGEFSDTSSSPVYNLGHLKNAVNIDVGELGNKLAGIEAYKNKPVYVYCSHSQRSRRASKMLADSGFTHVINVNGGVTAIRNLPQENCLTSLLETTVGYKIISAPVLCKKLKADENKVLIIDVRSDSAFRHITTAANINAFGTFKNSINIPLAELQKRRAEIPPGKEIIIVDLFGGDAAQAAVLLHENKYTDISILLEGIVRMYFTDSKELICLQDHYISPVSYKIISTADFKRLIDINPGYLPLDIRTQADYANKAKDNWRNIGHLQHAVNIPAGQLAKDINSIIEFKNKPVLVYSFSGSDDLYQAADILTSQGFTNVNVLAGGLFNVRWTAANVNGYAGLKELLVDVPAENL